MITKDLIVTNENGIHARPAAVIVQICSRFASNITLFNLTDSSGQGGEPANAKSIMNVLFLAAEPGAKIRVEVEGSDESEAMAAVEKLFADKFLDHDH